MATDAYYRWVRGGRRWRACRPASELRALLMRHAPHVDPRGLGMLGNENTHLKDSTPEDHTPFSVDAWPTEAYGWVCALDVMHAPRSGLDCDVIANRLLTDAQHGRAPWLKYLIWRGGSDPIGYRDVRSGWAYRSGRDHTDHLHISFRTDYLRSSIGSYNPLRPGSSAGRLLEDLDLYG